MDLSKVMAAAPVVRRVWRRVPGPLKIPLIVVGIAIWVMKRRKDSESGQEGQPESAAA